MKENTSPKGLIYIFTGNGKGKTTAALGMAFRALGHGFKVLMVQFIKGSWNYGELMTSRRLSPDFEILQLGTGFLRLDSEEKRKAASLQAHEALELCRGKMASGLYHMLILDEINYVVDYGLLDVEEVIEFLREKPAPLHLILTGRNAHPLLIELADGVTEMVEVKHPFKAGIPASKGIEY